AAPAAGRAGRRPDGRCGVSAVDRLTTLDTSFLWLERPDAPIHVGAVAVFEARPLLDDRGELRLDDLRARVLARLDRLPRLRRRLAPVPLDLDRPAWVDDPDFDVADHVRAVRLPPPGDDEQFRRLAERLHSESLPRDRPLWDLHVVTGLAGDRVGLVERVHHALVDGVGGVELATLLLDLTPDAPAPSPPPTPWRPAAPPDGLALAAAGAGAPGRRRPPRAPGVRQRPGPGAAAPRVAAGAVRRGAVGGPTGRGDRQRRRARRRGRRAAGAAGPPGRAAAGRPGRQGAG